MKDNSFDISKAVKSVELITGEKRMEGGPGSPQAVGLLPLTALEPLASVINGTECSGMHVLRAVPGNLDAPAKWFEFITSCDTRSAANSLQNGSKGST